MELKSAIKLSFNNDVLSINYNGNNIAAGKGIYDTIIVDGKEILANKSSDKIIRGTGDNIIYLTKFFNEVNLYKILKIKKINDEIEIEESIFTKAVFQNLSLRISIELSSNYRELTDSFVYKKTGTKTGVCFEGWPFLRYLGARGEGVPPVCFFVAEGKWYNFAKTEISKDGRIVLSFVVELTGEKKNIDKKYLVSFKGRFLINKKPDFTPCYKSVANEFYKKNFPYEDQDSDYFHKDIDSILEREERLLRKQLPSYVSGKEIEIFNTQVKDPQVRANYLDYVISRRDRAFYMLKRIYPLIPDIYSKRILDFGASHGAFTNFLFSNGIKITGFDIFSSNIAKVEGKAPRLVARGEELPYKDNAFDVVILWDIIEHLWVENAQEKSFSEINRVLKIGGSAIISAPNRLWPWDDEAFLFGVRYLPKRTADWYVKVRGKAADIEDRKGGYEFRMRTLNGYRKLFAGCGFSVCSVEMEKFIVFGIFERFKNIITSVAKKNINLYPGYLFCIKKEKEISG